MARRPDPRTQERWRRLLHDLEQSGETVAAFAARHHVSSASIYHWRKRLGRAAGSSRRQRNSKATRADSAPAQHRPQRRAQAGSFVQLSVVATERIEVELPSGVRIHVPPTQLDALRAAIDAGHGRVMEDRAC